MRELKPERIREMTEDDIRTKIRELKEELFHLRFRNQMRQLPNPLLLREKGRDVARLETILTEHRKGIRSLAAPGLAADTPIAKPAKAVAEPRGEEKPAAKAAGGGRTPAKKKSAKPASAKGGKKTSSTKTKSKGKRA
jgi:large subunit ribosomal protein L29